MSAAKIKCGPSYIASPSRFRRLLLEMLAPKTFTVVGPKTVSFLKGVETAHRHTDRTIVTTFSEIVPLGDPRRFTRGAS